MKRTFALIIRAEEMCMVKRDYNNYGEDLQKSESASFFFFVYLHNSREDCLLSHFTLTDLPVRLSLSSPGHGRPLRT